jgi:LysM repeat protein
MNQLTTVRPTRLLGLLALCALLVLAGTAAAQDSTDSARAGQLYTVESGDDLAAIAANFDVTTDCLLAANDIADPDNLDAGTEIVIPSDCSLFEQGGGAVEAMAMSAADVEYTVRAGDRLTRIAREYETSVACIAQANGILNPDLIYIGQVLVIPGDCQDSGGGSETGVIVGNGLCQFDPYPARRAVGGQYVVPFADMLDFIGCDFNVQTSCLADANGLGPTPRLTLGQTLFIDQSCPPWQAWPGTGTGRGAN